MPLNMRIVARCSGSADPNCPSRPCSCSHTHTCILLLLLCLLHDSLSRRIGLYARVLYDLARVSMDLLALLRRRVRSRGGRGGRPRLGGLSGRARLSYALGARRGRAGLSCSGSGGGGLRNDGAGGVRLGRRARGFGDRVAGLGGFEGCLEELGV